MQMFSANAVSGSASSASAAATPRRFAILLLFNA